MIEVGPFAIMGDWDPSPEPADRLVIRLAPQPAAVNIYGWGDQSSTRQHLKAVEREVKPGMRVADIGTGTGILAIAAAKMGAQVTAFESNPRVAEYAQSAFTLNGVDVDLRGSWPDEWDGQTFDLVLANLGDNGADVITAGRVIGGNS